MKTVIDSESYNTLNLKELNHYKGLLRYLSLRDVKVKYKQTWVGFGWAIIRPLINIIIFGSLSVLIDKEGNYGEKFLHVGAGIIIWNFVSSLITETSNSMSNNVNSEFEFSNTIYNYYLHPQWDDIGSDTLYIKILFVDYTEKYAIIEFIGEWNDAINNDIMLLKRDIIDELSFQGINKYILIGENVLNFHNSDDSYYEEWFDDNGEEGWIVLLNFREHVLKEFKHANLDYYFIYGGELDDFNWRKFSPGQVFGNVSKVISKRLA